ncbi:nucleoside-diphosphate kinase [Streptomyces nodosus]|uniref:nucleoside-diphosphate kinase n=1 Tax=Streptomyces nodosus TaxID=40318 RepID=UPI00381B296F
MISDDGLTADAELLGSLAASVQHITEDVQGTVVVKVGTAWCAGDVAGAGTVTDRLAKRPDSIDDFRVGLGFRGDDLSVHACGIGQFVLGGDPTDVITPRNRQVNGFPGRAVIAAGAAIQRHAMGGALSMDQPERVCVVPEWLSREGRKRETYAVDPYYRDAWDDLADLLGTERTVADQLHRVAPMVLKPDAVAVRGGARLLTAVRAAGFVPVAWRKVRFDRHTSRELWRYQLNVATRERIDLMDMIMPIGESLYILLRDTTESEIPATARLSDMKGPTRPEDREAYHLRRIAGGAQASALTYIHVADEPADILRELGVFFERSERKRLLAALDSRRDVTQQVLAALTEVEACTEASDLFWKPALDRLDAQLSSHPNSAELAVLLQQVRSGRSKDWQSLLALADRFGMQWSRWDRISVAAQLGARHLAAEPVIPDVSRSAWSVDS